MDFDEQITDDALLNAVRKRLLQEILREQSSPNIDIKNIVGGGGEMSPPSGVFEGMRQEDPTDYMVDITKSDVFPEGAEPGAKPIGWNKLVRRYRTPRGQDIETEKKK